METYEGISKSDQDLNLELSLGMPSQIPSFPPHPPPPPLEWQQLIDERIVIEQILSLPVEIPLAIRENLNYRLAAIPRAEGITLNQPATVPLVPNQSMENQRIEHTWNQPVEIHPVRRTWNCPLVGATLNQHVAIPPASGTCNYHSGGATSNQPIKQTSKQPLTIPPAIRETFNYQSMAIPRTIGVTLNQRTAIPLAIGQTPTQLAAIPQATSEESDSQPRPKRRRVRADTGRIEPPYPWSAEQRAVVQDLEYLQSNNIATITGDVRCKKCMRNYEMEYNLVNKFEELTSFIEKERDNMHDRAPSCWMNPALPNCMLCMHESCVEPVITEEEDDDHCSRINWLFLLLGQFLGRLKLKQLKYFCSHTLNHQTGAKDRLIFQTYLTLCKQLQPSNKLFFPH